jgi:preprotein translocase subunit SecE
MAKSKNGPTFGGELLSYELYKRNQGRLTRQLTALAVALVVALGAWSLSQGPLSPYQQATRVGIPLAISLAGAWLAFRLVNFPRFADFLISVEAEMGKVSWASWPELYRATIVVLVTMFFLGFVLLGYDIVWQYFFRWIHFLEV